MSDRLAAGLPNVGLDIVAAVLGLGVALSLLPLAFVSTSIYTQTIPVVLGGACVTFLYTVRRATPSGAEWWTVDLNGTAVAEIVGIGLVATVTLAVQAGTRTVGVVLLSGCVGALILLEIAFIERLDDRLVLAQIVAHAFVVRFTGLLTTPGLVGTDSWTHLTGYTAAIQEAGSLAPLADIKYYFAPLYHLTTFVAAELLGVSLRMALYLVLGGLLVLSLLLVYGIARYFLAVRWALLATSVFVMADEVIRWGMHIIPTSLGLVFFVSGVFAVVRLLHTDQTRADWALLLGSIVAVTLSHQVSAFISLVFLGSAVVAQIAVRRLDWVVPSIARSTASRESSRVTADTAARSVTAGPKLTVPNPTSLHGAFAFHLLFTGTLWMLTPWGSGRFLGRIVSVLVTTVQRSAGFLNLAPSGSSAVVTSSASTPAAQIATYVNAAGFLVLLFTVVVGGLALVRRHRSLQATSTIVIATGALLFFAMVLPLFGIKTFLPGRWFAFLYALMAVVGAAGLRHIGTRLPTRIAVAVLVICAVGFPVTMIAAQKATLDDPTFDDQWPRYAYSESELTAMRAIGQTTPASVDIVYTDHPYRTALTNSGATFTETINLTHVDGTAPPYDRVVYRTYQSTGAPQFTTHRDVVVTGQVSRELVCPPTSNLVYQNRDVVLCTRPGV